MAHLAQPVALARRAAVLERGVDRVGLPAVALGELPDKVVVAAAEERQGQHAAHHLPPGVRSVATALTYDASYASHPSLLTTRAQAARPQPRTAAPTGLQAPRPTGLQAPHQPSSTGPPASCAAASHTHGTVVCGGATCGGPTFAARASRLYDQKRRGSERPLTSCGFHWNRASRLNSPWR